MSRSERERELTRSKQKSYRTQITNMHREREEFDSFDLEKLNQYKTKILSYQKALQPLSEQILFDNYEKYSLDPKEPNASAKKEEAEEAMTAEHARIIEYDDRCLEILKKLTTALKKFSEEDDEAEETLAVEGHSAKSALMAPIV